MMTPYQQRQLALMRQMETSLASGSAASTIVPFQADYATDSQLALSLNASIPAETANIIQTKLIRPLRAIDPTQYYYPPESLHITFHSIRIIHDPPSYTEADIERSRTLLSRMAPSEGPFPFTLAGVFSLPTSVFVAALATPRYDAFIRRIRSAFTGAGIPDDKTYFTDELVFANTTICRYTHPPTQEFLETLRGLRDTDIGDVRIESVSLVETNAAANLAKMRVLGIYRFGQN